MSSLEVRAELVLGSDPARPYEKKEGDRVIYTMRSIQGDGVVVVGSAAQSPELDEAAESGRDCMAVQNLQLLAFKQGDNDQLFASLDRLYRGDRVRVWFTFDLSATVVDGRMRQVLRMGRITSVEVLERAALAIASSRRPAFVDNSAAVAVR